MAAILLLEEKVRTENNLLLPSKFVFLYLPRHIMPSSDYLFMLVYRALRIKRPVLRLKDTKETTLVLSCDKPFCFYW